MMSLHLNLFEAQDQPGNDQELMDKWIKWVSAHKNPTVEL